MNWLRLIRYKNLLIVFMTQLLVWYCLIYNIARITGVPVFLDFTYFMLLAISTVLISASGYIINDYFDIKIDIINRPEKVILEKKIPLRLAIIAHSVLNIIALLLAGIVAYKAHHYEWLCFQLICSVLLWFYSTHFKRQFIVGNVVVALLTAFTIVALVLYEPSVHLIPQGPALTGLKGEQSFIEPSRMCLGYIFFAFMLTWMREIVKDMEDHIGDAEEGCVTMPIKMGLRFSARFTQALGLVTIAALGLIAIWLFHFRYTALSIYCIVFTVVPLLWWCFYLPSKNTVQHYASASRWLKIIMLAGIASLIVYHLTILKITCIK